MHKWTIIIPVLESYSPLRTLSSPGEIAYTEYLFTAIQVLERSLVSILILLWELFPAVDIFTFIDYVYLPSAAYAGLIKSLNLFKLLLFAVFFAWGQISNVRNKYTNSTVKKYMSLNDELDSDDYYLKINLTNISKEILYVLVYIIFVSLYQIHHEMLMTTEMQYQVQVIFSL